MSMVIHNNMPAVRTHNLLNYNQTYAQKHMEKVSTGMKINSAQDDASAYSISERMRVRIRALDQAYQNAQNDSNLMKTAEGAVNNTLEILRTLKEKAINAANDSNTDEDRRTIQKEINQFIDQIDDNALVQFNGKYLIDGSKNNAVSSTQTVLLNQSLSTDTTSGSALTALSDRAGTALSILSTDKYQVSWVKNGVTSTTSGSVGTATTLGGLINLADNSTATTIGTDGKISNVSDKFVQQLYTPDKSEGIALVAADTGVANQISGFTISIMDHDGNIKKSANAALDKFRQYQRAENKVDGGSKALNFHTGADANVAIKVGMTDMRAEALGLKSSVGDKISVTTKEFANAAINAIENALTRVIDEETNIAGALSRFEYTSTNISTMSTNDQSSESVIRDADMATEMSGFVRYNVLTQAAQTMLAQANQIPNNVLSLLNS